MHSQETRIYLAILTGVFVLMVLIIFFVVTIIRYQKKKTTFHRERVKAEINSLEKERARIAADLHDSLGGTLSAIKLRLQCLEPEDKKNEALIHDAESYIDDAMQKLRLIAFNIMPQILQRKGLAEALNELIEKLAHGTTIKINCECEACSVAPEKAVHIYRIVQEVMNNTIKHAKASVVYLSIKNIKGQILLHIQDNGIGFDKGSVLSKSNGEGLQNIMSRVDLLNAKIFLSSEFGKGVDYLIEIPEP